MQLLIDKNNYKIAKRYADALSSIAFEKKLLNDFHKDLIEVLEIYKNSPDFKQVLTSPSVDVRQKKEIIKQIFEDKISKDVYNFLFVLIDAKRFDIFETIFYCFEEKLNELNNTVNVSVVSAINLKDELKLKLQNKLSQKMNKNVYIQYEVDKNIVAGLIISIGEKIIDLSLNNKFKKIEKELI
ncbi:MAG: ATP synthase F1 subunit delta [Cyanobacteria bacterium SIG30]|nr:ATP synthase F1 subunit delta [Cyanobacteria bacterium SIG30]